MSTVVLLGGAAATGKSSVTRALLDRHGGSSARPGDSFLRLAEERGVPLCDAFTAIPIEDAEDHYLARCAEVELTVSGQHFAIQPRRDSAYAAGLRVDDDGENYVGSLSDRLLAGLSRHQLILALLAVPEEVAFRRACARDGSRRRAMAVEDARRELEAERREFESAASRIDARWIVLDNSDGLLPQVVDTISRLL